MTSPIQSHYNSRALTYNTSYHPSYSRRLTSLIPLQPGQRVLSLCCGTGLDLFLAAEAIGPSGLAVGVDDSEGMLNVARESAGKYPNVKLLRGDVTDLASSLEVEGEIDGSDGFDGFDIIICSNAFILLPNPTSVLRQWKTYLRPGGVLVIDIPHALNNRAGRVMETVARRMGKEWVTNRSWVRGVDSFSDMLEGQGFVVELVQELEKVEGRRSVFHGVGEADAQFEYVTRGDLFGDTAGLGDGEWMCRARGVFREEWEAIAEEGRVEVVETLWVYLARSTE